MCLVYTVVFKVLKVLKDKTAGSITRLNLYHPLVRPYIEYCLSQYKSIGNVFNDKDVMLEIIIFNGNCFSTRNWFEHGSAKFESDWLISIDENYFRNGLDRNRIFCTEHTKVVSLTLFRFGCLFNVDFFVLSY